eukprot:1139688-Pelagomonas_calceolata.AAC.8
MNVLAPYFACLFAAMMEKSETLACLKVAKITPLYKKGSVLNPGNYRVLAVSGTLYRLYANVLREHLQHAAQVKRPNASQRLHAAFINFKQAYDTIPREAPWTHLQRIRMHTCLLAIRKSMYTNDEYILVDGCKQARVHPHFGVKQDCPLSPLLSSLYINDVDCLAENVQGAIAGTSDVRVTHMLYADDLCLTSNQPDLLQLMLDRLHTGDNVPVFSLGGARLASADFFKYLGMLFTKERNPQATAEHMCAPFLAGCRRIRQFASEYHLTDRPHTMLWLTRAYALPASMYACQNIKSRSNPGKYRMIAVSGVMYRNYDNVLKDLVTDWCVQRNK